MTNITEIIVGDLPEWYNEDIHDFFVESLLESKFGEDIGKIRVVYAYSGDHFIQTWDSDGDLISELPFDMSEVFEAVKEIEG